MGEPIWRFPNQEGQVCNQGRPEWPKGSIYRSGFMRLNPDTNTWTKVNDRTTGTIGGSYYDSTADALLSIDSETNPALNVRSLSDEATMPQSSHPITVSPSPAWTGAAGGWTGPADAKRVKWAWDDAGRVAYLLLNYYPVRRGRKSCGQSGVHGDGQPRHWRGGSEGSRTDHVPGGRPARLTTSCRYGTP